MLRALACIVLLACGGAHALAPAVPLPGDVEAVAVGPHAEYIADMAGGLTLDQVRARGDFAPVGKATPNYGYTDRAHWLRFVLPAQAGQPAELMLEVRFPSLDNVDLYVPYRTAAGSIEYRSQRLGLALEMAKRNRKKLAVMLLDLDGFKPVNDRLGHAAGDQVLIAIAGRLRASVRGSDTVARLGGDEFVVLAGDLERAGDAAHIAEKICDMLRVALPLEGELLSVGCSLGISVFPDDGEDADTLIAQADKAMYAAKSRRERGYAYFAAAG